jgi:hypothetical protein
MTIFQPDHGTFTAVYDGCISQEHHLRSNSQSFLGVRWLGIAAAECEYQL